MSRWTDEELRELVTGEKEVCLCLLDRARYLVGAPQYSWRILGELRSQMIPWTTQEISLLLGLWPTASAAQISKLLNRSRASICGQSMRLRRDDLLPAFVEKHFEVNLGADAPDRDKTMVTSIRPAKPTPPIDATAPPPGMRRCSLVELDDGQCRWPVGDVRHVATLFCGGRAVPGFSYCGYHRRRARCDSGLSQFGRCDKRLVQPSH